jgi:pimeloyl-ACP methyl ester carboxylesterase
MIRRSYIDNPHGGQIHLAETRNHIPDSPSVLLIHQTPRSWDEFSEVMGLLNSECHMIAMDIPGMGCSSSVSRSPTIKDYSEAASKVIEHYGSKAMTVCGHHTGGVIALELAASKPHLVESLVLSSTPWIDAKVRTQRSRKSPIDKAVPTRDGYHLIDYWRQRSLYYPDKVDYMDRFMKDALTAYDPIEGHLAVGQYHMELATPKIKCPVLIVEHMKDPFAVNHTPYLQSALPHAILEQIQNGSVALEVTAPEFSNILLQWLRREHKPNTGNTLKVIK